MSVSVVVLSSLIAALVQYSVFKGLDLVQDQFEEGPRKKKHRTVVPPCCRCIFE